jgi:hypothetical protein
MVGTASGREEGRLDDGSLDGRTMPKLDDSAAYAANWRSVLAVDAGMGVVLLVVGVVVMATVHVVVGGFLGALGASYVLLVLRRARRWSALRREAGL